MQIENKSVSFGAQKHFDSKDFRLNSSEGKLKIRIFASMGKFWIKNLRPLWAKLANLSW